MSGDHDTPVVLYRAKELYEAQEIHDALEAEGILSRIEGEYLASALGDLPLGVTTAPRVTVRAEDEPRAKSILDQFLKSPAEIPADDEAEPVCMACGAVMADVDTCPQCGWSYQIGNADQ